MDEKTIALALQLAGLATQLVLEVKRQSGLSNDELLALGDQNDAETLARTKAFLEGLQ